MGKKANRQRNIGKYFCVNELENQIIEKRMQEAHLTNFGEFARKSCLDKKIYTVDFSSLKEIMSTIASLLCVYTHRLKSNHLPLGHT